MRNLVIVESPSKSKTIEKYLGDGYEVVSSKGHIRDLAKKGKGALGVDVENDFKPTYVVNPDKKAIVKQLKQKAKQADQVFLATDPDREGEAISWHLAEELDLDINDTNRVIFNEITKDAVIKAFEHPRTVDMDLVRSQETRRILDRIIGFKLSTLLKSKIKSKSAGRVQSVALKLICEREREIQAFVSEEYWSIHADFEKDGISVNSELVKIDGQKAEIKTAEEAQKVIDDCHEAFIVDSVKAKTTTRQAKLPFITSTLQQEASTKLGFSAKKTMSNAQRLYEGVEIDGELQGLITYMRTDSTRLSESFIKSTQAKIINDYGKSYLGVYKTKNDSNAQDAHEAIRPTNINHDPESIKHYLTTDQYRLYKIIYCRALASLMAPAKFDTLNVIFRQQQYDFSASGSVMVFDGYLKVYGDYESNKNEIMPVFTQQESVAPKLPVYGRQHFTEPPLRFSEARLIKSLEELGIGRPSTYAFIIDTIVERKYVDLTKSSEGSKTKVFIPTEQGILTDEKLTEFFSSIINVKYTADMENDLDRIADGVQSNIEILKAFYDCFMPLVDHAYQHMEKREAEKTGETCPECGGDLVIRIGRFGKFISCSNFPKCKYTRKLVSDQPKEAPEPTGIMCPECGSELVKRKSRYGTYFVGCSAFPKCKYIKPEENGAKKQYVRKGKKK
ncbi:MAG: type I DNA topoisomerase [Erysipelotrichaceae bacterium]|nr:type I DNA topoisomerase [Erysipelotrichaceae bacterium]